MGDLRARVLKCVASCALLGLGLGRYRYSLACRAPRLCSFTYPVTARSLPRDLDSADTAVPGSVPGDIPQPFVDCPCMRFKSTPGARR